MTRSRLNIITAGIMLSMFLASMEGTVVATAMPSIVAQLGGLSIYSWVFSIYMLVSTTTVPLYGKLSDIYGRKLVYTVSMTLFLLGSILCGFANSMEQLILFRGIQGIGAGGVLPLVFTITGEIYLLEERTRLQGLFSGVWGVSSVIGPLIGGFLVDQVSWQWVFFINVFPATLATLLVWFAWKEDYSYRSTARKASIDFVGAGLLTLGALSLLLGLNELGRPLGWWFLGGAALFLTGLVWVERTAADPILPLKLFRNRLFNVSILHGILAGWAMFGSVNYIPLFVQAVLGTSATQAGISLTPMSLSWTIASIFGSRLLLKVSYRSIAILGTALVAVGALLMTFIGIDSSMWSIMLYTSLMGIGMGLSIPAFLIAVQSVVRRDELGVATSTIQFSRSIGGTIGVSVLGVFLSARLANLLLATGMDPASLSLESLINSTSNAAVEGPLRQALGVSIANMFIIAFAAGLAGLVATLFTPRGLIQARADERPRPEQDAKQVPEP